MRQRSRSMVAAGVFLFGCATGGAASRYVATAVAEAESRGVSSPERVTENVFFDGALQLARLGLVVRPAAPGVPTVAPLAPEERTAGLSALSEEERYHRFDALQARMPAVWEAMRLNHDDESVVVVPSITLDRAVAASGSEAARNAAL